MFTHLGYVTYLNSIKSGQSWAGLTIKLNRHVLRASMKERAPLRFSTEHIVQLNKGSQKGANKFYST